MQENFKQGIDITIEQWSVLYHLWKEDGMSPAGIMRCHLPAIKQTSPDWWTTWKSSNLLNGCPVKKTEGSMIYLTTDAQKLQNKSMRVASQTLNEGFGGRYTGQIEIAKGFCRRYENLK